MTRVHENLENQDFTVPDNIVTAKICTKSGKLAVDGVCDQDPEGSTVREEYFAKGTVPTEVCDAHTKLTICTLSGKIATSKCPTAYRVDKVYRIRIKGTEGTTWDTPFEIPAGLQNSVCDIHN